MDLAAALATIEDARPRRLPLAIVVAGLVVVAMGHPHQGVAIAAILGAWAVAGVVAHRHRRADVERDRRVGDAVSAFLQVEHDLLVAGPVEVHVRGARAVALDADGAPRAVEVRWQPIARGAHGVAVPVAGPVEVSLSELVPA